MDVTEELENAQRNLSQQYGVGTFSFVSVTKDANGKPAIHIGLKEENDGEDLPLEYEGFKIVTKLAGKIKAQ